MEGPHYFDDDAYTDMPEKELVAEVIREKALLFMRDEIPHGIAVVVERFKERPGTDLIDIDVYLLRARKPQGHGHWKRRCNAEKNCQCCPCRLRRVFGLPRQSAVLGKGKIRLAR